MEFHQFDGSTTEKYCAFITQWRQIASQIPLTTAAQKFAQFRGSAMNEFRGAYCPSDAKTQQRRFMQRFLSLPKGMSIRTYYNRIQTMWRYFPLLPGVGANTQPDPDAKREFLITHLPHGIELAMQKANYDWSDPTVNDMALLEYLQVLCDALPAREQKRKFKSDEKSEKSKFKKNKSTEKNPKKVCNWCTKNKSKNGKPWTGHTDEECRAKKLAGKTGEENLVIEKKVTDKESSPEKDQQEDTLLKEMAELCESAR